MAKKVAKPPAAPAGHPDGVYVYFIRMDDGDAKAFLFNGGTYVGKAERAAWDDTIPWQAKTYETTCNGVPGNKGGIELRFDEGQIDYREGVLLHPGLKGKLNHSENPKADVYYDYASFGCLVAKPAFIQKAYDLATSLDQTRNGLTSVPIVVADKGAHPNIGLTLTAKGAGDLVEVEKDQAIKFKVNLTGDPDGVSKDIRVFIKVDATGGAPGETVTWSHTDLKTSGAIINEADTTHNPPDSPSGFYVTIPKFKTSAIFTAAIASDTKAQLNFTIDSYLMDSPRSGNQHRWYSDYKAKDVGLPKVLIQNGHDPKESLKVIQDLGDLNLNVSGGVEGFHQTYAAKKGATYHIDFNAYSIPDSIRIYDNKHVYVDTNGFVSGDVSADFKIAKQGNGRVTIDVDGSSSDTAWDISAYLLHG